MRAFKRMLVVLALGLLPLQGAMSHVAGDDREVLAITGGRLVIGDGSAPIDNGIVIIKDGRVLAAGRAVAIPAGARRMDASGKWVTPGIVAGFTRIGLLELDLIASTNDTAAPKSPYSAAIDVASAIDWSASAMAISRQHGVTRALVAPRSGRTIFAGQGAVIAMDQNMAQAMRPRAFQFVELGELGARRAGGSRAAAHLELRLALRAASELAARKQDPQRRPGNHATLRDADLAALIPVVQGKMPLLVHVERAADIVAVLDVRREFPRIALVLAGVSEGWKVADRIAAEGVPVLASALNDLPASFEMLEATQSNAGLLHKAGVTIALGAIDDFDSRQARLMRQYAGNLVGLNRLPQAHGVPWDHAFAAISSAVAEAVGLGAEIGSLRPGRRADVVIWNTDPMELQAMPERVFIDGKEQLLRTRQNALRDRYLKPSPGMLPRAYD